MGKEMSVGIGKGTNSPISMTIDAVAGAQPAITITNFSINFDQIPYMQSFTNSHCTQLKNKGFKEKKTLFHTLFFNEQALHLHSVVISLEAQELNLDCQKSFSSRFHF